MKRFLSFLFCLAALAAGAQSNTVVFSYADFSQAPQTLRKLYLYPLWLQASGSAGLTTLDRRVALTDTNGVALLANILPGLYRGEFQGVWRATTNWFTITNSTGTIWASNCVANAYVLAGSTIPAYSMPQSDARYWQQGVLQPGSNTAFRSSGSQVFIDTQAGVGGLDTNGALAAVWPFGYSYSSSGGYALGLSINGSFYAPTISGNFFGSGSGLTSLNGAVIDTDSINWVSIDPPTRAYIQSLANTNGASGLTNLNGLSGTNVALYSSALHGPLLDAAAPGNVVSSNTLNSAVAAVNASNAATASFAIASSNSLAQALALGLRPFYPTTNTILTLLTNGVATNSFTVTGTASLPNGSVDGTYYWSDANSGYTNGPSLGANSYFSGASGIFAFTNTAYQSVISGSNPHGAYYLRMYPFQYGLLAGNGAWYDGQLRTAVSGVSVRGNYSTNWVAVTNWSRAAIEVYPSGYYVDLFGNFIVPTNSKTCGIQEAIDALPPCTNSTMAAGGLVRLTAGTFWTSNTIFAGNKSSTLTTNLSGSVTLVGAGETATAIVYDGPSGSNVIATAGYGVVALKDMTVASTRNNTNAVIAGWSGGVNLDTCLIGLWSAISGNAFFGSTILTEVISPNLYGALDLVGFQPSGYGPVMVRYCTFVACAAGINSFTDHLDAEFNHFFLCGQLNQLNTINHWPYSSPLSLGGGIVFNESLTGFPPAGGGNNNFGMEKNHFYWTMPAYIFNGGDFFPRYSYNDSFEENGFIGAGGTNAYAVIVNGARFFAINPQLAPSGLAMMGQFYVANPGDWSTWHATPATPSQCFVVDFSKAVTQSYKVITNTTGPQGLWITNVAGITVGTAPF